MKSDYKITKNKFLDIDERNRLLKYCKERADLDKLHGRTTWPIRYMLTDMALNTGLRISEIKALKMIDIHIEKLDSSYLYVRNGKGKRDRDVYLSKKFAKRLKDYKIYKRKTLRQSIDDESPLFCGTKEHLKDKTSDKPSTVTSLQISFKKAVEECPGLAKHYSVHSCRHSYGTILYHKTKNLRYVQKQLGHSNISMTSHYADILPSENVKLASMIDD